VTRNSTPGTQQGTNRTQSLPSASQSTAQPGRSQQRWKHGMAQEQHDATAPQKAPVIAPSVSAKPRRAPP